LQSLHRIGFEAGKLEGYEAKKKDLIHKASQLPRFPAFQPYVLVIQTNRSTVPDTKGSLKNNFTFYTPMHLFRLRCESSEYPDIPAFSRLAGRAPQRLKL
jgi:hypothetical protein